MLDSSEKSLGGFTFAPIARETFASRKRHIVTVFATICWFHELRLSLAAKTVASVQRAIEPSDRVEAVRRRWGDYKNGRRRPSVPIIALAEHRCPGARSILESLLWEALRSNRQPERIAQMLIGTTSQLGDDLLNWIPSKRWRKDRRWLRKRCIGMVEQPSLESLAVLTICMRIAASAGVDWLARTFYYYVTRWLLVAGGWLYNHGIAQGLAEYYETILLSKFYQVNWAGLLFADRYLYCISSLGQMLEREARVIGRPLNTAETVSVILKVL